MQCLPVHIDVGTNNEALLQDIAYMGLKQRRDRSPLYDDLVEEFFDACQHKYGRTVLMQVGQSMSICSLSCQCSLR
jgi:hypothetical protein